MRLTDYQVAEYILAHCTVKGTSLPNLYLQAALVAVQDWCNQSGEPQLIWLQKESVNGLFYRFPGVYYKYCGFGAEPIRIYTTPTSLQLSPRQKAALDYIADMAAEMAYSEQFPYRWQEIPLSPILPQ